MVVDCIEGCSRGSTSWKPPLNDVLRILGTFLEADRAYVFMREDDCMVRTHEGGAMRGCAAEAAHANVPGTLPTNGSSGSPWAMP